MFYYLHLFVLSIGFSAVGWFLAAIQAKLLIWLSLASLVVYLVNAQQGGVILAHGWLAILISISTVTRIWPSVWPSHIPYHSPRLWALILLIIWAIAATLIHLLASSPKLTHQELTHLPSPVRNTALMLPLARTSAIITTTLILWVGGTIALGVMAYTLGAST